MKTIKDHYEIAIAIFIFLALSSIGLSIHTTGDAGDSILHYLFSKYSFKHPELFFDHWAKPFFVLVTSPFAQFGFKGIILFNCLVVALTSLFTFWTARNLNIKRPWMVFIFILFAPFYFKMIFSGLTEYLFALMVILPIYLSTCKKYLAAAILVSFLPFVRSEGLIVVGMFGLFFLVTKQYKKFPFLLLGHILYSIVGYFYFKNILWVFTEIPYDHLDSPYGHGQLFDFVHRLNYVIEKPLYALLALGFLSLFIQMIRDEKERVTSIKSILVYGIFVSLFIAHSVFWWLGIFNSEGLPRVLNGVIPLTALIGLVGLNQILEAIVSTTIRKSVIAVVLSIVMIYPFLKREEGVTFHSKMFVVKENELFDNDVRPYLQNTVPEISTQMFYYTHSYVSMSLDIDHFDYSKHRELNRITEEAVPKGAILIWDDWYARKGDLVPLEQLTHDTNLSLVKEFMQVEGDRTIQFAIFVSNSDHVILANQ